MVPNDVNDKDKQQQPVEQAAPPADTPADKLRRGLIKKSTEELDSISPRPPAATEDS